MNYGLSGQPGKNRSRALLTVIFTTAIWTAYGMLYTDHFVWKFIACNYPGHLSFAGFVGIPFVFGLLAYGIVGRFIYFPVILTALAPFMAHLGWHVFFEQIRGVSRGDFFSLGMRAMVAAETVSALLGALASKFALQSLLARRRK